MGDTIISLSRGNSRITLPTVCMWSRDSNHFQRHSDDRRVGLSLVVESLRLFYEGTSHNMPTVGLDVLDPYFTHHSLYMTYRQLIGGQTDLCLDSIWVSIAQILSMTLVRTLTICFNADRTLRRRCLVRYQNGIQKQVTQYCR